jgi:transcriptional regulator with XRE-family HTH domain
MLQIKIQKIRETIIKTRSPDKIDVEVGRRIRAQRKAANLSQTALAGQLGVTFQQVQKYEKGITRVGAGRLTKIAHALGIPVGVLFGTEDDVSPRKGQHDADSPLALIVAPDALRLLRAYAKLNDAVKRRAVVYMIESMARRPIAKEKKGLPS